MNCIPVTGRIKVMITIGVRRSSGDSYVAYTPQLRLSASSTSDAMFAVERVALKAKLKLKDVTGLYFEQFGITIKPITSTTFLAEWEEEAA